MQGHPSGLRWTCSPATRKLATIDPYRATLTLQTTVSHPRRATATVTVEWLGTTTTMDRQQLKNCLQQVIPQTQQPLEELAAMLAQQLYTNTEHLLAVTVEIHVEHDDGTKHTAKSCAPITHCSSVLA